jgi:hypothetical protein
MNLSTVYAKLSHNGAGTSKLKLTGEINDGKDYSFSDTVVDFRITGQFLVPLNFTFRIEHITWLLE